MEYFDNILKNSSLEYVSDSVSINSPSKSKTKYVQCEEVERFIRDLFKNNTETIQGCDYQGQLHNVLYIDLDYYVKDEKLEEYLKKRNDIIEETETVIKNTVGCHISNFSAFSFVPFDDSNKQGMHTFIYCDSIINNSIRIVIKDALKETLSSIRLVSYIDKSKKYELPDESPLGFNKFILLPFCEKSDAKRRYKLFSKDILVDNLKILYLHTDNKNVAVSTFKEVDDIFKAIYNEIRGGCLAIILRAYAYLMFLSDKHPLFDSLNKEIEDSDRDLNLHYLHRQRFMHIFIDILYVCYLHDALIYHISYDKWRISMNICYTIIKNILIRFHLTDTDSKFVNNLQSELSHCLSRLNTNENEELLTKWKSKCTNDKYGIIKNGILFRDFLWKTYDADDEESESENENEEQDDIDAFLAANMHEHIDKKCIGELLDVKSIIKNHRSFFKWIINNFTDEFISFYSKDEILRINNVPMKYCKRVNDISKSDDMNKDMYISIATAILPFELYEQQNTENVISDYIMNWIAWSIYVKTEIAKSGIKKTMYIYNVLQTNQLHKYPYNQWIVDRTDIFHDIAIYYYSILSKLLETSKAKAKIYPMINLIGACTDYLNIILKISIKPLSNFGKSGYTSIVDGIYHSEKTTSIKFDELNPATSNIFPIRDGWIVWNDDGSYTHSVNNYDKFMPVCLNVFYDKDFKSHYNKEYNETIKYINELYPIEEERNYILKVISSVLNGKIRKDTLFIQYGGGADGKTFFSNVILAMLGENACQNNSTEAIEEVIKGKKKKIDKVPNADSLGSAAKQSIFFKTQSKANDTDEGGKVQLKNKRYCCIQEPDMKSSNGTINASVVKDLLSGGAVVLRELYSSTETTQLNSLIFLQTNSHMSIDDATDGTKRRVKFITMRSKFYSATTEHTFKTLKYHFKAEPELEQRITSSITMKSALFNILLPYCESLLKENHTSISDIKMPASYEKDTNMFFKESAGGFGMFSESFLKENTERFIPFKVLLDVCAHLNEDGYQNDNRLLQDRFPAQCLVPYKSDSKRSKTQARKELVKMMSEFFVGKIYIAREDIDRNKYNDVISIEEDENPGDKWLMNFDEFRNEFLYEDAKTEIEYYSKDKEGLSDVIIGGIYWNINEHIDIDTAAVTHEVDKPY